MTNKNLLLMIALFSFPLLFFTGIDDDASSGPPKALSTMSAFVLPRKHETHLIREQERGHALYEYYCALCHGKNGNADGFNSYNLSTPPAKHADPILMATLSDTQIQQVIREGGPSLGRSPQMPPWGGVFTDQEIADLTAFIRTLSSLPVSRQ